ncbi:MAG: HlyC/CorC family transporter [Lachnospiraceae bacterium]|nr:HlyC/CorC family transporter [Lachnospiraceae bacterium]MBR4061355.1 HlyC/CorC family transporter [Lachnospiraceae bacterium]
MESSSVVQIIIILVLVLLSGFFSSAETALSSVNRVRLRTMIEDGNKRAALVDRILDKYGKMISTILIGNNIVNLGASSLTTTFVMDVWGNAYVAVGTGILTLLVLLGGEIIPKTLAKTYAEKISLNYAFIIDKLMWILTPVIFLVDKVSGLLMKLLHIDPNAKWDSMTESELKTYVDVSHEDGVIESEEREMIYNVFNFSDAVAKDVMIPRINMITVDKDATYSELAKLFKEYMYTRIPVYEDDQDNMIGLVNIKDLLFIEDQKNFRISSILRKAHYTYEFKKTADLMLEMREKAYNVTFVLNEYGACVGMITMEDLLEEIVGDIRDEYDDDEKENIVKIAENQYLVEGSMKIDDINDVLDTDMNSEDYDSIAGLMIEHLDRLPEAGECVTLENDIVLRVSETDQNRVTRVLVKLPEKIAEDSEEIQEE